MKNNMNIYKITFTANTDRGFGPLAKLKMKAKVCASSKKEAKAVVKKYFKNIPDYEGVKIKEKNIKKTRTTDKRKAKVLSWKRVDFVSVYF
jgi:hypothetical protein